MQVIEVDGLTKRFGDTLAVDDPSFAVEPGRVTGFLGPNGAGKTTTMRLILGLDYPTSGEATVNGMPFAQLAYGLGVILRHTAGAITASAGLLFVATLLATALPQSWQASTDKWLPAVAGSQVWATQRARTAAAVPLGWIRGARLLGRGRDDRRADPLQDTRRLAGRPI